MDPDYASNLLQAIELCMFAGCEFHNWRSGRDQARDSDIRWLAAHILATGLAMDLHRFRPCCLAGDDLAGLPSEQSCDDHVLLHHVQRNQ